uniref:Cleft lip and palate transmembrane protein 1 homolog n=2 Tax=Cacopsylla melanoneura TaxID=428564 RepID=A0A8D8RI60_9HEMI
MAGANEDENTPQNGSEVVATEGNATAEGEVAPAAAAQQARPPSTAESFFAVTKSLIVRGLVIYFISSFFRKPAPTPDVGPGGAPMPPKFPALNLFENGTNVEMYVFLSEDDRHPDFNNPHSLVWKHDSLVYGDWTGGPYGDGTFRLSTKLATTESLRNNGSIYLHVYFTKPTSPFGDAPTSLKAKLTADSTAHGVKQLNRFKKLKFQKTQNLLTGQTEASLEEIQKAETIKSEIISHWHPNLTINIVTDQTNWVQGSVPPPLNEYIEFTADGGSYKPAIFFNDYWNMLRDYSPINSSVQTLELTLTYQPLSLFKWQIYSAQTMRSKWSVNRILGDQDEPEDEDQDSLKEALLETSPYLLAATVIVSILHSVFELLAFKNDIQFWNNRQSLEGLSVRSVFFNVFQSVVVLLYVLDNDANTLIRISCFVSVGIELWKINKVLDISFASGRKALGFIPIPEFKDKGSYIESSTKQYDELAFKYLSWALFPLLAGYAVYSLLYLEHKGWYSWVLNMLYGFLLTFGFIMMTPQLFINYKLKSVAHLPWRMMSYKCLNTFIDDIFAFVIKMPTMYRLGCLRDDIVFFIFLYQRYIYRVDPTRVNEFGYSAAKAEQDANNAVENKPEEQPKAAIKSADEKKKE